MDRIFRVLELLEKYIYLLFVFLLPTQLAYHFWPDYSFVFGIRVDYLAPTVYLTDILFLMLMACSCRRIKKIIARKLKRKRNRTMLFWVLGAVAITVVVNLVAAELPQVALFKWIKIFEVFLCAAYVYFKKGVQKDTLMALFYSLLLFSFIGIFQFLIQKTIGGPLLWLGERSFFVNTPGIALASLRGVDYMRAYSTFPHPNAFAGFLWAGGALVLLLNSFSKIFTDRAVRLFVLVSLAAFLLTFSFGALIAGVLTIAFNIYLEKGKRPIKGPVRIMFYIVIVLSLVMIFLQGPTTGRPAKSENVILRFQQAAVAGKMFIEHPLFGVGLNNFIPSIKKNIIVGTSLFLQPVHNIYLLLLSEGGLVGFVILFYLADKGLFAIRKQTFLLPILFIILTGFFDHYWFTLQQNQLLLGLVLGVSLKKERR